ncbi:nitrate reductase cytochrome c-type subunit [Novispirillum itersonii]|uniref:nitrate reductase cytochrome c-type subunit n=1 Tax=Novispirillum itersonii TaxID=189 RepID=UPI00037464D8|nr:nitrate reductase cytochrome c-type subunit [Novispirillum itersonii]
MKQILRTTIVRAALLSAALLVTTLTALTAIPQSQAGSTAPVAETASGRDVAASGRPAFTGAEGLTVQEAPPIPKDVTDDRRRQRNYPEQPPVIPHSVAGYQLDLNANKCLTCHSREFTGDSQAPMVSVTHFQDRDGQVLGAVSPRRYFCMQCHVPQTEAQPRVQNTFKDMDSVIRQGSGTSGGGNN